MGSRSWAFFVCGLVCAVAALCPPAPVLAAPASLPRPPVVGPCQQGTLPGGALWRVCVPSSGWNGDVVVWAHGYVAPAEPVGFSELALADGTDLATLVQRLGFAYATTSYRTNGLAVVEGMADIRELVALLPTVAGRAPRTTYLTGASQGGLIAALMLEQSPELFGGGLAACAPLGDFARQIDYWGDVRVLFDAFFPDVIPGTPTSIPPEVVAQWGAYYAPAAKAVLEAHPQAAQQLARAARIPVDSAQPATVVTAIRQLLWYHVSATNDNAAKLGGNPYENHDRRYSGSDDDGWLNRTVARSTADPLARAALADYATTGRLARPLITLHTTGDPIVPYWHELAYVERNLATGTRLVTAIPVRREGHCTFTAKEVVAAFTTLVLRVRTSA